MKPIFTKTKTQNRIRYNSNSKINTDRLDNYTKEYIRGKLRFKPGSTITYDGLKAGINNLNATQNFSTISYCLQPDGEKDDLDLVLKENPTQTF